MIKLYTQLNERINKINFSLLWTNFKQFKFALYDDEWVCLAGTIFKRDERFIGNTSIKYNDEYIAIWYIKENKNSDLDVLAANIVHEMFHAFQYENKEKRWANEILGLGYEYTSNNLQIKNQENSLLAALYNNFNHDLFNEFLILRKYRQTHFPKEFDYEAKVEVIEGMANFVELNALKQLNYEKYIKSIEQIIIKITTVENLIPIRNICYKIGAILLIICQKNNIYFEHPIGETDKTIFDLLSCDIKYYDIEIKHNVNLENIIKSYYQKNATLINDFILKHPCQIKGKFKMYGVDPMNTIKHNDYLYCSHFIAYFEADKLKFLQQECVAKVDEQFNILEVYF